jgi:DNA-binding PadR family transcriptional regulator
VLSRPDKPLRKIYTITEAGWHVLQEWVAQPTALGGKLKSFVMSLISMGDFDGRLASHLQQRREVVAVHHLALVQAIDELSERSNLGQRLALEYGLAMARAELDWLDNELAPLSVHPKVDRPEKKA